MIIIMVVVVVVVVNALVIVVDDVDRFVALAVAVVVTFTDFTMWRYVHTLA